MNMYLTLFQENPRTTALLTIAKINGLDVEIVQTVGGKDAPQEYIEKHQPLGKVYSNLNSGVLQPLTRLGPCL